MPPTLPAVHAAWPTRWRVLAVLALYAAYLPLSGYTPNQFRFDAAEYWELSLKFTRHGSFSLLAFDEPLRGYLGPLLILPARFLCHVTGWSVLNGARVLGAGWAALLFGVAIPQLWERLGGRPLAGGRWLVLVALGFVFWRDYFNFTLTDMPALTLLLLGLAALLRPGWGWAFGAGLLLAAVVNLRPVYLVSAPGFVVLAVLDKPAFGQRLRCAVALVAGAALLLLPQQAINRQHFGENTPFVLARLKGMKASSLYLEKLNWGLNQQKYETNAGTEYPAAAMLFRDPASAPLLREAGGPDFLTLREYFLALLRHPVLAVGMLARHLFNGLDLQYPTPYVVNVYQPSWGMATLNYTVWFGAALVLLRARWQQQTPTRWLVLLALLLPCLAVLPLGMECRYLLPLHLLLCAVVSFGWPTDWTWQSFSGMPATRRLLLMGGYVGFVGLCFAASAATQATLEFGPRSLF